MRGYNMKSVDKLNNAIKTLDASRGHEVVVYANQALKFIVHKYKIIFTVG